MAPADCPTGVEGASVVDAASRFEAVSVTVGAGIDPVDAGSSPFPGSSPGAAMVTLWTTTTGMASKYRTAGSGSATDASIVAGSVADSSVSLAADNGWSDACAV